jgi:hypothetical protein
MVNDVLLHMAHHNSIACMNDLSRFSVDLVEKVRSAVERVEKHGTPTRQTYNVVN